MIKQLQVKVKKQTFPLYIDPYKMDLLVMINVPSNLVNKVMKKAFRSAPELPPEVIQDIEESRMNTGRYLAHDKKGYKLIYIKAETLFNVISTFDHEHVHLIHHILSNAGFKLSDDTEEAYAYSCADAMEQFMRKLK